MSSSGRTKPPALLQAVAIAVLVFALQLVIASELADCALCASFGFIGVRHTCLLRSCVGRLACSPPQRPRNSLNEETAAGRLNRTPEGAPWSRTRSEYPPVAVRHPMAAGCTIRRWTVG